MRTEGSGLFLGRESEEALTVATSVVEGISNNSQVPTALYSAKINEYHLKLQREQEIRDQLENKIKMLKKKVNKGSMLIEMQKQRGGDNVERLRTVDQRNCMQSGANYTTHPQYEAL